MEASLDYATSTSGFLKLEVDRNLHIQLHRTVRMPDDNRLHQLPPSLGVFPLYNVSAFSGRLPESIAKSGGVFLPMWQREAMWIQLETSDSKAMYAVRVNIGQVNAISGLTLKEESSEQDYVRIKRHPPPPMGNPPEILTRLQLVVPDQRWIDGIAVEPGVVRQFVAMPCNPDLSLPTPILLLIS